MKITKGTSPGRRSPTPIRVYAAPGQPQRGLVRIGPLSFPCALGRSGVTHLKREGDGATPAGRMRLLSLRYRPDTVIGCPGLVAARPLRPHDGWSDDPADGRYNTAIRLPSAGGHERMWRDDRLYDLVGILDWNIRPRIRRAGSAIFLHLARDGFRPTEGCLALRRADLLRLLAAAGPQPEVLIAAKPRKRR